MLADDMANDAILNRHYAGLDRIQSKINAAQKFSLATDFALAADGLCDNFSELEKIAPFCRLPYPLCWFEVAQADRKHWMDAPLHYPGLQGAPARVGFLTEAIDNDLANWKTMLCWSLRDHPLIAHPKLSHLASRNNISPIMVEYNTNQAVVTDLSDCIEFHATPMNMGLPEDITETYFATLGRSDWAGEIRYLFAILGLLNARNVTESAQISFDKLNKQRVKGKKHPLSAHTLLKIRPTHKPALIGSTAGTARSGEIRAHFCRGHFKTRRTGVFWWGPHMRGRLESGFVAKDYEIT